MSTWGDMIRRAEGEAIRKEDEIKELKKKIDAAAKSYVEDCIDAFIEEWTKENVEFFQDHYDEMINIEDDYIVERLNKEDQDRFWELAEENDLEGYPEDSFWRIAAEIIPELEVEEDGEE